MRIKVNKWFVLANLAAMVAANSLPAAKEAEAAAMRAADSRQEIANDSYRLVVTCSGGEVRASLEDKVMGLRVADGRYLYRVARENDNRSRVYGQFDKPSVTVKGDKLRIRGVLAGLSIEHTFVLPRNKPVMEERIILRNKTKSLIALSDFEAGFQRRVTDKAGQVFPELAKDRWVAIPLRVRATDPKGYANDFSINDLITKPGYEPRVNKDVQYSQIPSPHRHSEGWAWTHGAGTLGIFVFSQENMLFSVVSSGKDADGATLRFGGACMISGEPAALARIAPGQAVDLGVVRYQSIKGGYAEAMYAFRDMLDEKECRFPKNYNPPVHWEQLYDMWGAWDDRAHRYTKEIVEQEAAKGRDYSCEALYLDPGWDTAFGTFLWGEEWLGPRKQFIQEMQSKYGLKVSLHCPLATWMSHTNMIMGPSGVNTWPKEAARIAPPEDLLVPAVRGGRRNLALLPDAKPNASSVYQSGTMPIHQIAHLNDGWYGNSASWIADKMPAWTEVDLGGVYQVSQVYLGNDHAMQYTDRTATDLRILVATEYNADSNAASWRNVSESHGEALQAEKYFAFAPAAARWVRVEILRGGQDLPRLDEIEIYEANPVSENGAESFARIAKRGPNLPAAGKMLGPLLCLGSKQYRDEAEKRLLANCADGVVFLMYDGNWWNGGCLNPDHGHPVPYRIEDHIRANLDLARRVHAKYPKVLIEMHDPIGGGNPFRVTPVYYKYGLPGSYDENWGFELMWDPLEDLKQGRGRALYYYNMGCDIPIYLHIDLRKDTESCAVLWWYASTCRHLGIGGTSPKPAVVEAHKHAMKRYRELDRFYKRGKFYGINEEIHLHVLRKENAFVVNLFNMSDETRTIGGRVALSQMGLDPKRRYSTLVNWGSTENDELKVSLKMAPWSAAVAEFRATKTDDK